MPGKTELLVLFIIFGLPLLVILAALIDILKSEFQVAQNKVIWVLVTIFLPLLGAILYFVIGRSQRTQQPT
jgi:heme/copper-type cytochrome/quinol oxidase subunit 2